MGLAGRLRRICYVRLESAYRRPIQAQILVNLWVTKLSKARPTKSSTYVWPWNYISNILNWLMFTIPLIRGAWLISHNTVRQILLKFLSPNSREELQLLSEWAVQTLTDVSSPCTRRRCEKRGRKMRKWTTPENPRSLVVRHVLGPQKYVGFF